MDTRCWDRRSTTGTTRSISTSAETGEAPGRVDSPPTSRTRAPSSASCKPWATAAPESRNSPPSENESGVTLTTPMTSTGSRLLAGGQLPEGVLGDLGRRTEAIEVRRGGRVVHDVELARPRQHAAAALDRDGALDRGGAAERDHVARRGLRVRRVDHAVVGHVAAEVERARVDHDEPGRGGGVVRAAGIGAVAVLDEDDLARKGRRAAGRVVGAERLGAAAEVADRVRGHRESGKARLDAVGRTDLALVLVEAQARIRARVRRSRRAAHHDRRRALALA